MKRFPKYLEGQRVRLVSMDDKCAPPVGTEGTVTFCSAFEDECFSQVGVKWDNGSSLICLPEDQIEIVKLAK